jgi:hypothetical protein
MNLILGQLTGFHHSKSTFHYLTELMNTYVQASSCIRMCGNVSYNPARLMAYRLQRCKNALDLNIIF